MDDSLDVLLSLLSFICLLVPLVWLLWQYKRGAELPLLLPIMLLVIFIFIGVNLKVFYIQFIRPDDIVAMLGYVKDRMLQGEGAYVLLPGLVAILLGVTSFLLGYSYSAPNTSLIVVSNNSYAFNRFKLNRVIWLLLILFVVSFVSYYVYDMISIEANSSIQKRFNSLEGGTTSRLQHLQYYFYKLATFVRYGVYLVLLYLLFNKQQSNKQMISVLFAFYILSVFISSYFGNRAHVLSLLLDISFIFLLSRPVGFKKIYIGLVVISVAVIMLTTTIREGSRIPDAKKAPLQLSKTLTSETSNLYGIDDFESLSEAQKSKLLLYQQCRERIELKKMKLEAEEKTPTLYWNRNAKKLAPQGTGKPSLWVGFINSHFNEGGSVDLCSGGIDFGQGIEALEPLSEVERKILGITDRFLQGGYFIDVFKTSHIVRNVPTKLGYLDGQSIFGWVFAPIPRSIWPDKPLFIRMPPVLATIIFQEPTNNMPPGVIAEMYLNFGLLGVIFGMAMIGLFLRYLHDCFQKNKNSLIAQAVYAIIVVRMSLILFNSSFGTAILKTAIDLLPLILLLWYVLEKKQANRNA